MLGTGQVLYASDRLLRTEVDDEQVREVSTLDGLPIGTLLKVKDLVAQMVAIVFLGIGVLHRPRLTAQALVVLVERINLSNGAGVVLRLGALHLDGEVAAFLRSILEGNRLPAVSSLKLTLESRILGVEVGLVARVVVLVGLLKLQLVEFRLGLSPRYSLFGAYDIEDNHLVLALLQPATRHVERLLRAYRPNAAKSVPVHPNLTFSPGLEVQERVANLLQVEVAAIVAAPEDEVICFLGEP